MEKRFRAWDKKEKCFIGSTVVALTSSWNEPERYEPNQWTGLKDKNCIDIYEEDIVIEQMLLYRVTFNSDGARLRGVMRINNRQQHPIKWSESELRIVGNTYESPDLLNK